MPVVTRSAQKHAFAVASQEPFLPTSPISKPPCSPVDDRFPCPQDADASRPPRPAYSTGDLSVIQQSLRRFVPTELADMIMREAELDPYIDVEMNAYASARTALEAYDHDAQWCFLVSPVLPSLTRNDAALPTKPHKVKFFIKSYRSQWNASSGPSFDFKIWFEACILKPGRWQTYVDDTDPIAWYTSLTPNPKHINMFTFDEYRRPRPKFNPLDKLERWHITANPQYNQGEWNEVMWTQDDVKLHEDGKSSASFFDSLEVGDRVVVFARAQHPGWLDQIFHARMEISYSLNTGARV